MAVRVLGESRCSQAPRCVYIPSSVAVSDLIYGIYGTTATVSVVNFALEEQ